MKRLVVSVAGLVLVMFVLFVIRETREIAGIAYSVDPRLGHVVLIVLLVVYLICLGIPAIMLLRLPRRLTPPTTASGPEFDSHLRGLGKRLSANPLLNGIEVRQDHQSVERAVAILHERAKEEMASTASVVFLSTAVSQSGRLDGLMVLVAQTRMVWRIAHIYAQRPSIGELMSLYANVASTVFLVRSIDDGELEEIIQPVLAPVLAGSALGAMPGFSGVANLIMQSVLQGGFNAFLTLRVGCVTSLYCGALTRPERRSLRQSATAQAAGLLPGIVIAGAARVSTAVLSAAKESVVGERAAALTAGALRAAGAVISTVADVSEKSGVSKAVANISGFVARTAGAAASTVEELADRNSLLSRLRRKMPGAGAPEAGDVK